LTLKNLTQRWRDAYLPQSANKNYCWIRMRT